MSLSKFIELPDVKAKLEQEFITPRFNIDKPLLGPVITSGRPKMGTAFDYLLRFFAKYLDPNALSHQWVTEMSLEILNKLKDDDTVVINSKYRISKARNMDELPASYIEECKELKNK